MTVVYEAPTPCYLDKGTVSKLAAMWAEYIGYQPGGDLNEVVRKLGGRIRYQDFWKLETATSGSIRIEEDGSFEIFLSNHTSSERDRFTIAHELGHLILHFQYKKAKGESIGRLEAARYGSDRVEYEANWFAASFLMPEGLFHAVYDKAHGDIAELASEFQVSYSAAKVRAQALGLET